MGVVVPHGVLFRGAAEGRIRKQLLQENLLSAVIGGLLILLPMTTSRAVWVILGILVILVAVLMAIDRLKPGKLLGDGGNVIDAQ